MAKYTIIADSSCDLKSSDIKSDKLNFDTVPLSIVINDKNIVDEDTLDTKSFVASMKTNKSKPLTACPSPEAFADKMRGGNEYVFCVTITSKLSGTYNAARLGAEQVMQEDPKKKIFVVDTLSASAGAVLIIYELIKLIEDGSASFDQIVKLISEFRDNTRVKFLLQDFGNLVKTGRMSKVQAIVASALNFKLICGDNNEGEIKQFAKSIGMKKALATISEYPCNKARSKDALIAINHCNNPVDASALKTLLETKGFTNIKIFPMRGLACFYANEKGLILGY